jgi:hypothetical protein
MSAVPVQSGQTLIVGFGAYEWTGYLPEDGLTETTGHEAEDESDDLNGNPRTKIRSGPYVELAGTFTVDVTDPVSALYGVAPGAVVSLKAPGDSAATYYEVQEWTPASNRLGAKVTCRLRKETEMDYTPA